MNPSKTQQQLVRFVFSTLTTLGAFTPADLHPAEDIQEDDAVVFAVPDGVMRLLAVALPDGSRDSP